MIGKIFCKLGLHNYYTKFTYYPHINADVVTFGKLTILCVRCLKTEMVLFDYTKDEVLVKDA